MCFAWAAPHLYTAIDGKPKRTLLLRRVRNIRETGRAALVVDRWSEDWRRLAYVLVEGPATLLTDGPEHATALALLAAKYPQYETLPLAGNAVIRLTALRTVEWRADARAARGDATRSS